MDPSAAGAPHIAPADEKPICPLLLWGGDLSYDQTMMHHPSTREFPAIPHLDPLPQDFLHKPPLNGNTNPPFEASGVLLELLWEIYIK